MSKHRVAVLKVVSSQLSVTAAAAEYGMSRGHLHRLLRRYRDGGLDDLEPRSRRPHTSPHGTSDERARPDRRAADGAHRRRARRGPGHHRLAPRARGSRPSRRPRPSGASSTRPASSSPSRASARAAPGSGSRPPRPTSVWQSDFTHWRLADGTEVEILNWLDDHSRYLLACTAFRRVAGDDVVATFTAAGDAHGWPAATLTDNGAVYTSRFTGGRNGFEYLLAYLGVRQKNGAPGHPQTQGKVERFHQTLKRWLGAPAGSADPRRAAGPARRLPARLQRAAAAPGDRADHARRGVPGDPRALPAGPGARGHFRLRYDVTDSKGAMTLRRAGRLYHLKVGAALARRRVLAIVDEQEVTVVALDTGEILSTHLIEPDRGYWRNQRRDPGRWPGSQATG